MNKKIYYIFFLLISVVGFGYGIEKSNLKIFKKPISLITETNSANKLEKTNISTVILIDPSECNAPEKLTNNDFNNISNNIGNTNNISGWTIGGTYTSSGSWASPTGRVNVNSFNSIKHLEFRRDAGTTTTIEQTITGDINDGIIELTNLYWVKTYQTNQTNVGFNLYVKYNNTTYATISTTIDDNAPTITGNNGATVNITHLPTISSIIAQNSFERSPYSNLRIKLPLSGLPSNGTLKIEFVAQSHATEVRDIGFSKISVKSCSDLNINNDNFTNQVINNKVGGNTTTSIYANDTNKGSVVNTTNSNISTISWPAGITLNTTTGIITVAAGTPKGTYNLPYNVCDKTYTTFCRTAYVSLIIDSDTDSDGVLDLNDLDNDNDGISDYVEITSCGNPTYRNILYEQNFGTSSTNGIKPYGISGLLGTSGLTYKNTNATKDGHYSLATNTTLVDDFGSGYNDQWSKEMNSSNNLDLANGYTDHTVDASGFGYMAIFNPQDNTSTIWQSPNITVKPGTAIEVSLWLMRLNSDPYNPNLTIQLYNASNNSIIGSSLNTGEFTQRFVWEEKKISIPIGTNTSATSIYIKITSQVNSGQGNDFALDDITISELYCDNDNDGIPNHLDTDSDNDGCPDAIEGAGTITASQLDANGRITGGVSSTGIPLVAGTGQGAGVAYDTSKSECIDTDGDGLPDYLDLDDDNDGILDVDEMYCDQTMPPNGSWPETESPGSKSPDIDYSKQIMFWDWSGVTLDKNNKSVTKSIIHNGVTYTATLYGYEEINTTGTPFKLEGFDAITWEGGNQMIGRYYNISPNGTDNSSTFKEVLYKNVAGPGVVRINLYITAKHQNGTEIPVEVLVFDTESTATGESLSFISNGTPFQLFQSTGVSFNPTYITGVNTNTVTYLDTSNANLGNAIFSTKGINPTINISIDSSTGASKQGFGFALRLPCDIDNDGIPNYLDTDSDNDGCPDAIEGAGNIISNQLKIDGSINSSVDANGVPTLVDGGQGIGSATNATVNACICTKPANTTGTALSTNVGITTVTKDADWPQKIKGAHLALESRSKGLVITRMTTSQIENISHPKEGMIVFDTENDCLKIYSKDMNASTFSWKCFNKQTCPDN